MNIGQWSVSRSKEIFHTFFLLNSSLQDPWGLRGVVPPAYFQVTTVVSLPAVLGGMLRLAVIVHFNTLEIKFKRRSVLLQRNSSCKTFAPEKV